ncbi:hypothetical protein GE061_009305 [Apolygus lucorum]|uniref:Voltage-dependent anion-selective channel protein 3 n=1 Tax=Apolygus lucorum TaxID=248454 RepID=A0A8S9XZT1_APOLU|nr:hypothetical protein GE061_009305 [Apolygus lucorum]
MESICERHQKNKYEAAVRECVEIVCEMYQETEYEAALKEGVEGKSARDVLGKGYHFGLIKLDIRTKSRTAVEFNIGGVMNLKTKNVVGNLETKYRFKEYGIRFSEKWNTDNVLSTEIALEDFCKGAKLSCETSFSPKGPRPPDLSPNEKWTFGDKALRLKGDFRNAISAVNLESEFRAGGPLVRAGVVMGYSGCLVGCTTAYDTIRKAFKDTKVAMGFMSKDFTLHTSVTNGEVFGGSVHHATSASLETGLEVSWTANGKSNFAIGCRYSVGSEVVLRVKVDNFPYLSFGYSHKLKEGINISVSTQLNGRDYLNGSHNVGFLIELEA